MTAEYLMMVGHHHKRPCGEYWTASFEGLKRRMNPFTNMHASMMPTGTHTSQWSEVL